MPAGIGYPNPFEDSEKQLNAAAALLARDLLPGGGGGGGATGFNAVHDPFSVSRNAMDISRAGQPTPGSGSSRLAIVPGKPFRPNRTAEVLGSLNSAFGNLNPMNSALGGELKNRAMKLLLNEYLSGNKFKGMQGPGDFFKKMFPEMQQAPPAASAPTTPPAAAGAMLGPATAAPAHAGEAMAAAGLAEAAAGGPAAGSGVLAPAASAGIGGAVGGFASIIPYIGPLLAAVAQGKKNQATMTEEEKRRLGIV